MSAPSAGWRKINGARTEKKERAYPYFYLFSPLLLPTAAVAIIVINSTTRPHAPFKTTSS